MWLTISLMKFRHAARRRFLPLFLLAGMFFPSAQGKEKPPRHEALEDYVVRVGQAQPLAQPRGTVGMFVERRGSARHIASDYKAHHAGDLVQIVITQSTVAQNTGSVGTARGSRRTRGLIRCLEFRALAVTEFVLAAIGGDLDREIDRRLEPDADHYADGRVVAVLASGALVIEAQRGIAMNNERQTVCCAGVARPGDVAGDGRCFRLH